MKTKILTPTHVRTDERGMFIEILNGGIFENLAYGTMKKGAVMGNHYHKKTSVFFFLTSGSAKVKNFHVEKKEYETLTLNANQGLVFLPHIAHAILFTEKSTFIQAKNQKYSEKGSDFYRYEVIPGKI